MIFTVIITTVADMRITLVIPPRVMMVDFGRWRDEVERGGRYAVRRPNSQDGARGKAGSRTWRVWSWVDWLSWCFEKTQKSPPTRSCWRTFCWSE